ncbi:TRAUB-domain-containing protein [Ascodesmis nigricans]|uniref:Protein BFR2 n=1 Tax=Ascodesmis nigricans TaxID=341454 RepID=A0A4S2N481_9PEZI|nr:TRAUB-domain-containing protein [Ascodesmis nigricans]
MPKPRKPTTLNAQLAMLDDPSPADFDPEALEAEFSADENTHSGSDSGSDSEGGDDGVDHARDHYVAVGKSRLRKAPELEALGEAYVGTKVSRGNLYDESSSDDEDVDMEGSGEDVDEDEEDKGSGISVYSEDSEIPSDDAFGSDDERFEEWKFRGSRTTEGGRPPVDGDKITGSSSDEESDNSSQSEEDEDMEVYDNEDEDDESSSDESTSSTRAQLKNLLTAAETASSAIAESTLTRDQQKGAAIRTQRSIFDSLLRTRIQLQKALTASSSLPIPVPASNDTNAAESAAFDLFNSITALRTNLYPTNDKKRIHMTAFPPSTSTADLWTHLTSLDTTATPYRTSILSKWALKTTPITIEKNRLDNKPSSKTHNNLVASITTTLASSLPHHITKSRGGDNVAVETYDDSDFYGQLLRALVDSRLTDSTSGGTDVGGEIRWAVTQQRERKKRKGVDTKASKGRKLKYTVHEKLAGFMAPVEGANRWREEQRDELFGSLLGVRRGLDEDEDADEDMSDGDEVEEGGVRLFR